jgi:hypothetical protein
MVAVYELDSDLFRFIESQIRKCVGFVLMFQEHPSALRPVTLPSRFTSVGS